MFRRTLGCFELEKTRVGCGPGHGEGEIGLIK